MYTEHITHVEPAPRPDSATEMGEADVRMSVTPIDNASTGSGCDGSAPRRITRGKLFIGGLSWDTTEETMTAYFGAYGELTDGVA
jgi:RNA recognition motif-containing protein